jgi:hypothetical protein
VKAIFVLVAAGLTLVAAGCGGDDDEAIPGRVPAKLAPTIVVEGGPPRQRALLRRVAGGMQKTTLTRIVLRRQTGGDADVAISLSSASGPSVRAQWDAWIVAGGFSRRLQAAGLPARVAASGRAGVFTARPKVRGKPDPRPLSRAQQTAVVRAIRRAATRVGAEAVRMEVHRPYGVAIALSLGTKDPARFLKERLRPLQEKLDVHRKRLEGVYLAVLDESRRLAVEWGSWTRNPAGSYWVRRDLANCSPIRQSEPPGTEPPPACPA